ncbi:ATP-binding protein [Neobacillus sp. D3-1R]|uniref:ATP-binding protein n=1 Tax=Neobacillus sp. D3-1R TaxID=3445778 RepID=UPI003FA14A89
MFYFGQFLYHVLIVLFPIFFHHLYIYGKQQDKQKRDLKFGFIIIIMLFCTMSYPVEYQNGYLYDFRVIPILIAFLYGGFFQGSITLLLMLIYRFIVGGNGFYITLINYFILTLIISFIYRKFKNFQIRNKMITISLLYWFIALTRGLTLMKTGQYDQLPFMLTFSLLTWLTLITVFFVIENLEQQTKIQSQLQRADKLNVISQLAASVAHEVRNPMTSVFGFLQLLQGNPTLDKTGKKYIDISLKELEHAQSIINDYLALAKPNSKSPTLINLTEELHNTIELMTSYTNIKNVKVESSIQESLFLKGLKDEMKQVLVNIMKNGIEAMEKGGLLMVNAFQKEQTIVIEIQDNGKGMNKKQLKNLGTPFYSMKEKGTGVGLTVSYQIIHSMKGSVDVESEEGKGTKFTIKFPCNLFS